MNGQTLTAHGSPAGPKGAQLDYVASAFGASSQVSGLQAAPSHKIAHKSRETAHKSAIFGPPKTLGVVVL